MNIERQIEFDKVKDIWAGLAITDWAKEKIKETSLYTSESELRKQLKDTTDARFLIEKLDFIFSKGKLSLDMDGVEPEINTARRIKLMEARHPLMDKTIAVPLQFEVGETVRGIVITGPNTGGYLYE